MLSAGSTVAASRPRALAQVSKTQRAGLAYPWHPACEMWAVARGERTGCVDHRGMARRARRSGRCGRRVRSEERRVGKSGDVGGGRSRAKKKRVGHRLEMSAVGTVM